MTKRNYNEIEVKNNMHVETEKDDVVEPREKKQLQKLVEVQPKKVKRSLFGRLITGVMGPEGLPGIGTYVNEEIIKPSIKNIIFEAITSAASMAMYGDRGGPNRYRNASHSNRREPYKPSTNYSNKYPHQQPESRERVISRTPRHGVEEYVITDRFEAAHVLTALTEAADRYNSVSVADYYDLIGVNTKFTDNDYGWTIDTITDARIITVRGGHIIKFPPVEVI